MLTKKNPSQCWWKNLPNVDQKIISIDIDKKILVDIYKKIALTNISQKKLWIILAKK